MPNFSDGFLAAALQHFSYNSEQVIHALLEGALPPELKALDPQMPLQAPSHNTRKTGRASSDADSNGRSCKAGCIPLVALVCRPAKWQIHGLQFHNLPLELMQHVLCMSLALLVRAADETRAVLLRKSCIQAERDWSLL